MAIKISGFSFERHSALTIEFISRMLTRSLTLITKQETYSSSVFYYETFFCRNIFGKGEKRKTQTGSFRRCTTTTIGCQNYCELGIKTERKEEYLQ